MLSCSVMSNSLRPCGLWPARIPVHGIFQARQSGLPFAPPGDLPDLGIEPASLVSPALTGGFFTTEPEQACSFILEFKLSDFNSGK